MSTYGRGDKISILTDEIRKIIVKQIKKHSLQDAEILSSLITLFMGHLGRIGNEKGLKMRDALMEILDKYGFKVKTFKKETIH